MVQAPIRTAVALSLIGGVWVVSGLPTGAELAAAGEFDPSVRVNINDHCIEGSRFARNQRVSVKVRDAGNNVVSGRAQRGEDGCRRLYQLRT